MTHNIYIIHILWLQILFLIQWFKIFWDSPTQNSASDGMWWYGVYINIIDDSHEDNDCVGVKRYIPWKPIQTVYKPHIITYCPTQNFTLNSNLKSKFLFRPRILEKNSFENFAWANIKNFCITESEMKFAIIWYVYRICYESYLSHSGFFQKMTHSSLL